MDHKSSLTKILSLAGAVLIWLTILVPICFTLARLISSSRFLFDYLLPLEFFPIALLGGLLLIWAAFRARSRLAQICWPVAVMTIVLIGGQALAVLTGLASGETELTDANYTIVLVFVAVYLLALLATAVAGSLLVRDLFRSSSAHPVLT
jgi:hypothetical protein